MRDSLVDLVTCPDCGRSVAVQWLLVEERWYADTMTKHYRHDPRSMQSHRQRWCKGGAA